MYTMLADHSPFLIFSIACVAAFAVQYLWLRKSSQMRAPWLMWLLAVAVLISSGVLVEQAGSRERENIRRIVGGFGELYASELEQLGHEKLADDAAPDDPLYLALIETEKRWLALNPTAHDIYTLRKGADGKNRFLVDSETDYDRNGRIEGEREQRTALGEVYDEEDPGLELAFRGETNFEFTPITDRWGTWVSAFVPLRDSSGRINAVLGVDFDAQEFAQAIQRAGLRVIGFMALVQATLLGSSTVVALLRRQIAERRKAGEILGEREERFRTFMDNTPAIAYLKDIDGRYHYINRTFEKRVNLTLEQLAGKTDADLWAGDVARRLRAVDAEVIKLGKPLEVVETIPMPEGETNWLSVRFPYKDEAGRALLGGISMDITERVQLEEQLRQSQKMQSVGQLAAGVAHDFNNILSVISGYAGMLCDDCSKPDEILAHAGKIVAATGSAAELVQHLLAFSRKQVVQARPLDPNALLDGIAQILRRVLGEEISLQCNYAGDISWVCADPTMIQQVIMNMAVNARDAMPNGGQLSIGTATCEIDERQAKRNPDARPGRFVRVTVQDSGCGMDEATLGRAFDPFFTTKDVGKGSGLGLATAYGTIQQHEGWIEVHSKRGEGARFDIFLPACEKPAPEAKPDDAAQSKAPGGTETILLVEDNEGVRLTERLLLERRGYRVLEAASGIEALEIWKEHGDEVDLLLTDMVMPDGLSGRQLGIQLKLKRQDLKIVYASGYSPEFADKRFGLEPGERLLQKPFSPEVLACAIRQALDP